MAETIISEIIHVNGFKKVLIIKRNDGMYTYRRQELTDNGWSSPTIDAGVYDSPDTAESEARLRVPWLRELFH